MRFVHYFKNKLLHLFDSTDISDHYVPLKVSKVGIRLIKQRLTDQIKLGPYSTPYISDQDRAIVNRIHKLTTEANRNNITRTQAYYNLFHEHPELHWALLAHMVSRNGGWNMTDLRGELLPALLKTAQAEHIFSFLERANALIFQDAYPQLLLYKESLKKNRNLFHLCSQFNISVWMQAVWTYFWNQRDSVLLTIALIVNEQNYIQKRVLENKEFKMNVIDTFVFKSQSLLQLNQVIFPYISNEFSELRQNTIKLTGLILEDFSDLRERIEFGKKLYCMLFGFPNLLKDIIAFTAHHKHSGSRADYWPQIFTKTKSSFPAKYIEKLKGCQLLEGAAPFYSPELVYVWKDRPVIAPERYDWCTDTSSISYLKNLSPPTTFEITEEHCFGLNKIELAILAQNKFL